MAASTTQRRLHLITPTDGDSHPHTGPGRFIRDFHNHTVLFKAGRVIFVTYGLFVAAAFIAGTGVAAVYSQMIGLDPIQLLGFSSLILLPAVLIGARLFSILLEWRELFVRPIQTLLKPGYMLHGGVGGGALAIAIYAYATGTPVLALTDAWAFALPLGESIARIGCHVYGCCWGKPTTGSLGIRYTNPDAKVVRCAPHLTGRRLYPAQLFGTGAYLGQFGIQLALLGLISHQGMMTGLYLVLHPIIRVLLERFRSDDRGKLFGPITHTNLYSLVQFAIGLILIGLSPNVAPSIVAVFDWAMVAHLIEPHLAVFLAFNALVVGLAFGLHIDTVGSWIAPHRHSTPLVANPSTLRPVA